MYSRCVRLVVPSTIADFIVLKNQNDPEYLNVKRLADLSRFVIR